jgi:hypothetical protein
MELGVIGWLGVGMIVLGVLLMGRCITDDRGANAREVLDNSVIVRFYGFIAVLLGFWGLLGDVLSLHSKRS